MVTSRTDASDRALCIAKGADAFFSKPFNLQEITQWATERLRPGGSVK
jgi:DNA-binding response OmpR family regulator